MLRHNPRHTKRKTGEKGGGGGDPRRQEKNIPWDVNKHKGLCAAHLISVAGIKTDQVSVTQ